MTKNDLTAALSSVFISPNVCDSNFEPANVVDAIDKVARGLYALSYAVRAHLPAHHPMHYRGEKR